MPRIMVSSSKVLNTGVGQGAADLGDGVDTALLCDVLTEQQALRILRQKFLQGMVDLDREVAWRLPFGQRLRTAIQGFTRSGGHLAPCFGLHRSRRIGRKRLHHFPQRLQLRPSFGIGGGGHAARAHRLVGHLDGGRIHPARFHRDLCRAQQRILRLGRAQLGQRAPFHLEVGLACPIRRVVRRCRKVGRRVRRQCSTAACTCAWPVARSRPSA